VSLVVPVLLDVPYASDAVFGSTLGSVRWDERRYELE
jgi:hypothetical protein